MTTKKPHGLTGGPGNNRKAVVRNVDMPRVRATPTENAIIRANAKAAGKSISGHMRDEALKETTP